MSEQLTFCIVFAHPDDEAFGVSGTVAKYAARAVRSALICATRGEAGMTAGLAGSPAALAALRSAELACAANAMGLAQFVLLDFPDGGAERWEKAALAASIGAELKRVSPSVVITFDDCGVTRHPDHITVHEITRDLVVAGIAPGVLRLYYHVVTCQEEASPEGPSLVCVPREAVDVTVDIAAFETAKRAALYCHRTQAADTAQLLEQPDGNLVAEHFMLGWDANGWRPTAGEGDLLAGLADS